MSEAGDVNNDGFDDFLVGPADGASVRVYSGRDGSVLLSWNGQSLDGEFGWSIDSAGDVNADGFADIAIGAHTSDYNGIDSGRAYVCSGNTGAFLWVWDGDSPGDGFGNSVGHARDVNGDGFDDVIVGAFRDDNAGIDSGSARVYSGAMGVALFTIDGDAAGDTFGASVAGVGDINSDGRADVLVGSPFALGNAGRAKAFSGATAGVLFSYSGVANPDQFGCSVSGAGDTDGDSVPDFVVGACGVANYAGSATLVSGASGSLLHVFHGAAAGDQFSRVSGAGDIDADGREDIIVGALTSDIGALDGGSATVYSGNGYSALHTIVGTSPSEWLGWSVSGAGDVNGNGKSEFVIGALFDDTGGTDAGKAVVYTGECGTSLSYGDGCPGTGGFTSKLSLAGCATPGGTITLSITKGLPNTFALVFFGLGRASVPIVGGCTLYASPLLPSALSLPLFGGGPGTGAIAITGVMPMISAPATFAMQVFSPDAGVPWGFSNSNGVKLTIE